MHSLLLVFVCTALATAMESTDKPPMPGAPVGVKDINSEEHMNRVWGAVNGKLNDQASNNGPYHFVPVKILSAKTQVVAGMNHIYEVLIGESNCKKGEMQASELTKANCSLRDGANRAIYKITVWEKPWENFTQYSAEKVRDVAATEQI